MLNKEGGIAGIMFCNQTGGPTLYKWMGYKQVGL